MKQESIRHVQMNAGSFEPRFASWLADNFDIYEKFERMALFGASRGRDRVSAKFLFEKIRWDSGAAEATGEFKLNNSMAKSCAVLFAWRNPKHADLFEFRSRHAA